MSSNRAKIFQNGRSQAVRLPQAFRFPEGQTEVSVRREGSKVILEPVDEWSEEFRACLGAWKGGDIPRPSVSYQRNPFGDGEDK